MVLVRLTNRVRQVLHRCYFTQPSPCKTIHVVYIILRHARHRIEQVYTMQLLYAAYNYTNLCFGDSTAWRINYQCCIIVSLHVFQFIYCHSVLLIYILLGSLQL